MARPRSWPMASTTASLIPIRGAASSLCRREGITVACVAT